MKPGFERLILIIDANVRKYFAGRLFYLHPAQFVEAIFRDLFYLRITHAFDFEHQKAIVREAYEIMFCKENYGDDARYNGQQE